MSFVTVENFLDRRTKHMDYREMDEEISASDSVQIYEWDAETEEDESMESNGGNSLVKSLDWCCCLVQQGLFC